MTEVVLIMAILLPLLMGAAFLLGRHLHRRQHQRQQQYQNQGRVHVRPACLHSPRT